ncbi:hypothetical protein V2J09_004967 [Rumex salicifolius]
MAFNLFNLSLLLTIMGLISSGAKAQSSSTLSNCASTAMNLSPCLSNNTRSPSRPTSACCSALTSLVQASPDCLCSVLSNGAGAALGMVIPLALPKACNIQSSALSQCSAGPPTPSTVSSGIAPSATPSVTTTPIAESPTESPSSDIPTDSGSKTLPAFQGFSGAEMTKSSLHFVVFVASIISWISAANLF